MMMTTTTTVVKNDEEDVPSSTSVIISLTADDFEIDTSHPITLKNTNSGIVFFFVNNDESLKWSKILLDFVDRDIVSVSRTGKFVATCNLAIETKVAELFYNKIGNTDTSLSRFSINKVPCFIVYQEGCPITFYEGGDYAEDYDLYNREMNITPGKLANYFNFFVGDKQLEYRGQYMGRGISHNKNTEKLDRQFLIGVPLTEKEKEELGYRNAPISNRRRRRNNIEDTLESRRLGGYVIEPILVRAVDPDSLKSMYIYADQTAQYK